MPPLTLKTLNQHRCHSFILCFIELGGFRGVNSRISVSGREKDAGVGDCVSPTVPQVRARVYRCESRVCSWLTARALRRLNASLCAHPEKDELILFGGEFFNGKKVSTHVGKCVAMFWRWSISCHAHRTILTTLSCLNSYCVPRL